LAATGTACGVSVQVVVGVGGTRVAVKVEVGMEGTLVGVEVAEGVGVGTGVSKLTSFFSLLSTTRRDEKSVPLRDVQ
jgi:hypothetical protein